MAAGWAIASVTRSPPRCRVLAVIDRLLLNAGGIAPLPSAPTAILTRVGFSKINNCVIHQFLSRQLWTALVCG
jgi:hypothetical protein